MASRKRARSAPSTAAAEPTVTLIGGEPCPTGLVELWRGETLCDVHVQAACGAPFAAHRVVLAAGSSTLRALLTTEMSDKATPALPEVPADVFKHVLGFLYDGSCEPERRLLPELLRAANYLGVEPLKQATATALTSLLGPENALDAWSLGEQQAAHELAAAAKETALARFEELGDSLAAAPLDKVQALLADERLTAASEEAVFTAVQRVVDARQPSPDEATVLGLMRHVRFAYMRREFLDGTVRRWPRLQGNAGKKVLRNALTPNLGARPAARHGFGPRALWVLGGQDEEDDYLDSTEVFDFRNSAWAAGPPLCTARYDGAAAVLGDKLYLLGGQSNEDDLSTVEAFDSRTGAWSLVAPMLTGRYLLAAASVGGRLYAIGGLDGEADCTGAVEAFDPQTGTWTAVAPMPTPRNEMGAAVVGGKIYVIGGFRDGIGRLATVEVYDPATNTWATAAPMSTARDCLGVAALGGLVYAAGGVFSGPAYTAVSVVEAYDPQTNTWATVAPMSTPRKHFGLAEMRGKLYAVGDEENREGSTAEVYDPKLDSWTAIAPLSNWRYGLAVAAI